LDTASPIKNRTITFATNHDSTNNNYNINRCINGATKEITTAKTTTITTGSSTVATLKTTTASLSAPPTTT